MARLKKSDEDELNKAQKELDFQKKENIRLNEELIIARKELVFLNKEKSKRAAELGIANIELAFQDEEKGKRAAELGIANIELAFQDEEKEKRAAELGIANIELAYQDEEKEKRAAELGIANIELAYQDEEKEKRADELVIANKELLFQNEEKEKRANELIIANRELIFQNEEKEKRANELIIANKELIFQNEEKEKRAAELIIANKELLFQNREKAKRAIENKELEAFSYSAKLASQYSRSLLEASLDPLVTISADGKITDVNEALIKVTGIERENLIGTDFSDYFTEPQKAQEGYQQVFKNGFVADYPLTITHKNGKLTDVLYNASVYKDEKGYVLGVFAAARDVTLQKKIEANLEKSLQEISSYKDALDESSLVTITDEKGIIKYANDNFCRSSKYTSEELIGKNHRIVNSEYHSREFMRQLWEKIEGGGIWRGEIKNRAKDGSMYWVDTTIVPFKNEDGKIYQYVAIRTDVTAQKLSSQYSLSLIEASLDPLVTINTEGKITDMNQATVNIIGKTREKLKGTNFFDYFTEPQKARRVYEEVFLKGYVANYPLVIRDHKLTDVLFNGSVYRDDQGNVLGAVVVARDITEQKRIEKELREAKIAAELATAIAEEEKIKAENAARSKQQFLSNMSHEIRTPMNAIIGFTKVVLKTQLTAKQREYLAAIKISGDALIVLINDILDLAKVDAGKMTFEKTPFKMALSIAAMLHLFETKIQEKNLELVIEYDKKIPDVLVGDPIRLHQIILNLVSNALKFTNKGCITVRVAMLREDDEKVTIEFAVSDTGIGITEDKMEKIFENFQQASSDTSRLYGGTGLGLAIVKQLVEPQGGSISVKSTVDVGSTFSFTLSFEKTDADAESGIELIELDEDVKNIKVLVVEDMALNQLLMKTLLDDFGFDRDIASNGKIAIEKLLKKDAYGLTKAYDIILMDLQMPEMNGFEATEYIRNTLKSKIPIIALTADVTTVDLAKCKAVGMNDYIAKPIDERLLYTKIVSLVKKNLSNISDVKVKTIVKLRCTDMSYLLKRTKSNPTLMMEMISAYLEQTPPLISAMKQSLQDKDWNLLHSVVHKMIPSFAIMGMNVSFESMAKQIQEYAQTQEQTGSIIDMVLQIENICVQACAELQEEFNSIKNINDEK